MPTLFKAADRGKKGLWVVWIEISLNIVLIH